MENSRQAIDRIIKLSPVEVLMLGQHSNDQERARIAMRHREIEERRERGLRRAFTCSAILNAIAVPLAIWGWFR